MGPSATLVARLAYEGDGGPAITLCDVCRVFFPKTSKIRRLLLARGSRLPYSPGSPVITVSTFESEPEAPWLSVTVTRIVKLPSRYECDALIVPWLDVLPLVDETSPQLMVYDHGPSLFGSLNDAVSV